MRALNVFLLLTGSWMLLAQAPDTKHAPDAKEIVSRSVGVNESDWKALPQFAHVEKDVEWKGGHRTTKSYEVTMIEGTPYNKLIAIDDRPLPPEEQQKEEEKMKKEIEKRQNESPAERAARIAKYEKERNTDHLLMREMVNAFDFKLVGENRINGHPVWVLEATPKPDYHPINSQAKVLTGMQGKLYIDKAGYHWVKVEAEVIKPVNFDMFIAKVRPGTQFVFEQAPVGKIWLPRHFAQTVNAKVLGVASYNSREEEFYANYHRMPSMLAAKSMAAKSLAEKR
jgi:hypothetical protein